MGKPVNALRRDAYWHGVFWTGEPEALVVTGICGPDDFPGLPGQNKWTRTFKGDDGRKVFIKLLGRRFEVYLSNEEILARGEPEHFRAFLDRTLQPVTH